MPPPTGPSSTTTTDLPSRASRYAVVIPAIPAPTTHTSARASSASADSDAVTVVAIQTEVVSPESLSKMPLLDSEARDVSITRPMLSDARLRVVSAARVALRLDRDAVDVDHLAAEPAGDCNQDDTEHGEQEGNCRAAADPARAAVRPKVKVRDEDQKRDDVQARVPVRAVLHRAVCYREPVDEARHRRHDSTDDAAQQRVEGHVVSPDGVAAPKVYHVRDERENPERDGERDDDRVNRVFTHTRRTCHSYLLLLLMLWIQPFGREVAARVATPARRAAKSLRLFPQRKLQHVRTTKSFEPALQRLQELDQIILLLLGQIQFLEAVVVVDHVEQCRKAPVVIEPALHVREQSAQGGRAISFVRRTVRLELVYANLRGLVRVPPRLGEERRDVTLRAGGFPTEERFAAGGCRAVETARGRRRRGDSELIELQRGEFRGRHVRAASFVAEACLRRNRIFLRVVESLVEERPLPLQFKVSDVSVPVRHGAPAARPRVVVDARHPEGGRDQSGRRFAVGAEGLAVEVQLCVEFSRPPTGEHFLERRVADAQKLRERARVGCERDDLADVEVAVGPAVQAVTDAGHESIVNRRVADGATEAQRLQTAVRIERALHAQDGVEVNEGQRGRGVVQIDFAALYLRHEIGGGRAPIFFYAPRPRPVWGVARGRAPQPR